MFAFKDSYFAVFKMKYMTWYNIGNIPHRFLLYTIFYFIISLFLLLPAQEWNSKPVRISLIQPISNANKNNLYFNRWKPMQNRPNPLGISASPQSVAVKLTYRPEAYIPTKNCQYIQHFSQCENTCIYTY